MLLFIYQNNYIEKTEDTKYYKITLSSTSMGIN